MEKLKIWVKSQVEVEAEAEAETERRLLGRRRPEGSCASKNPKSNFHEEVLSLTGKIIRILW